MANWPAAAESFNHGQKTLSTTASMLLDINRKRREVVIINHSAIVVYVGNSVAVSATNGAYLSGVAGSGITVPVSGQVWVIAASGTPAVSYIETVDDA